MPSANVSPTPRTRAVLILFFAEMTLSPFVAAIALLAPVAAHWGIYGYLPAIIWFAIFLQCLFIFRWRGLWFLAGPPVAFLAIMVYLVTASPVSKLSAPASVSAQ